MSPASGSGHTCFVLRVASLASDSGHTYFDLGSPGPLMTYTRHCLCVICDCCVGAIRWLNFVVGHRKHLYADCQS